MAQQCFERSTRMSLGAITSLHGVHMKVVILAGGFGTRISEETALKPKPLVEIGDKPILWHILKIYSHFGINAFITCCGYKDYQIKEYVANYFLHTCDVTFHMDNDNHSEAWHHDDASTSGIRWKRA